MTTPYTRTAPQTLESPLAWLDRGRCRDFPKAFNALENVPAAKAICRTCPVLEQCSEWIRRVETGNSTSQREGVIAGLTPVERTRLDPVVTARKEAARKETAQKKAAAPPAGPRVKPPTDRPQCGKFAGYRLHERNNELYCDRCLAANAERLARKRAEKRLAKIRGLWAQGMSDAEIAAAAKCRIGTVRQVRDFGGLQENSPPPRSRQVA
ncbi:WhiB family transcriptional regulator [Streptomyces omiyaensis]|uniref:WhiB family transcriptional regulator n=1 Tax=Streptomyces omiyaensis TaxID=68247 RepID=UPI0036F8ED8B